MNICTACNVSLHDRCIVYSGGASCSCEAEAHFIKRHPDLQEGIYRETEPTASGYGNPVRHVDYELEPYEVRRATENKANKSKPVDDEDDARATQLAYRNRYVRF